MIRKIIPVVSMMIVLVLPTVIFASLQTSDQDAVSGAPKSNKDYTLQPDYQPQAQTTTAVPSFSPAPYDPYAYAVPLNSGYKNLSPAPHVEVQFAAPRAAFAAPTPQVIWPQVNNCHVALYCD